MMKSAVAIIVVVASIAGAAPPQPIYTSRYATVYYQGPVQNEVPQVAFHPPARDSTEAPLEVTTEPESEQIKTGETDVAKEKLRQDVVQLEDLKQEAVYYIYHPSGLLQRVVYLAKDDPQNMAYTARFQYEDVQPIREPIYTYDPETFEFSQLQVQDQ